jgi:putative tricarboxylic transport membrane protein
MNVLAKLAAITLLAIGASAPVAAEDWVPRKTVSVVVHTGPGAGSDVFARAVINIIEKEKLAPVRFVVVNKTGGGSTNAINYTTSKDGDDYTLAVYASNWTTDYLVQKDATNSLQNLTPIANLIFEPALIMVRSDSQFKTLKDFIESAKAAPNMRKQAGGTPLGRDAMLRHVLVAHTGAQWPLISFPGGGERLSALLGGHVDTLVLDGSELGDFIESGKLRALAQVADKRVESFPTDVPTIRESGYDIQIPLQPRGVMGPPNMSKPAAEYYRKLLAKLVESPGWKQYVREARLESSFIAADELAAFLGKFAEGTRSALKSANIEVVR